LWRAHGLGDAVKWPPIPIQFTGQKRHVAPMKKPPPAVPVAVTFKPLLGERCDSLQQLHDLLGQLVGLRDHRVARLLQNLRTAQIRRFGREVGIHDPTTGG